jgi:glutamyl-tRNA synthetase
LRWFSLNYDEGPITGGEYGPYLQSERTDKYQKLLNELINNNLVYRCFCTKQELENKREVQMAAGQPPRYDRTCLHLSSDKVKEKVAAGQPFIWRFKLNHEAIVEIDTLERGVIKFEYKNFSDFALTRSDGSFTFLFSNFVDDFLMQITHVIRGEDHLTNTPLQAALYNAFSCKLPRYWHLPMICNVEGKKMSKRDFGFGIQELRDAGYLPMAILNYLAILGNSLDPEIQSLGELTKNYNFENISSTGAIKFDAEKLKWVNHKWIERTPVLKLVELVKPFLHDQIDASISLSDKKLEFILEKVKANLKTLVDIGDLISFYFKKPEINILNIEKQFGLDKAKIALDIIKNNIDLADKTEQFIEKIKSQSKDYGLKFNEIFGTVRYLLTGSFNGISVHDLMEMLSDEEIIDRLKI